MIRTKIVATLGPASASIDTLVKLFEQGVDVCRLNFSHGDLDTHLKTLKNVRAAAGQFGGHIAILGDLCGPKIRLGTVADEGGSGGMPIEVGQTLVLQRAPVVGKGLRASSVYPHLVDDLRVGDRVLIEDGLLRFIVADKNYNEVALTCLAGGILKSNKGINLPGTPVNISSITDRDWECVEWSIENDLDFLALSFVRRADELQLLREHLRNRDSDIHLISKIEKAEALQHIDAILECSEGLMIARGDLGVEMDVAQVPIIQKDLIRRCQSAGKPVIVATQMLQSMIEQSSPTRAEVSDVANAIFDGTDAVMLSGETSVGKFPLLAVHMMNHVGEVTEEYIDTQAAPLQPRMHMMTMQLSAAVARGVWQIVMDMKVKLVAVWSQTGATARIFSKYRFPVPVLALSSDPRALRRMCLNYGVIPVELDAPAAMDALVSAVDRVCIERKCAAPSDRIVIVAGAALGTPGTLNGIVIHTVGEPVSTPLNSLAATHA